MRRFWDAGRGRWLGLAAAVVIGLAGIALMQTMARRPAELQELRMAQAHAGRVPNALGSSLARTYALAGERVLAAGRGAPGRGECSAAIAEADAASLRAGEDARAKDRNTQSIPLVLAAEDAYRSAAATCVRAALPVCGGDPKAAEEQREPVSRAPRGVDVGGDRPADVHRQTGPGGGRRDAVLPETLDQRAGRGVLR